MGTRRPVHHRTDIASRCSDEIEGVTQFGQKKKKKTWNTHRDTENTHSVCRYNIHPISRIFYGDSPFTVIKYGNRMLVFRGWCRRKIPFCRMTSNSEVWISWNQYQNIDQSHKPTAPTSWLQAKKSILMYRTNMRGGQHKWTECN